jgi:hypothetical protein
MNRGSANGNAFVDWRTKCIAVLNHYIYVPSLKAHACARDPTTVLFNIFESRGSKGNKLFAIVFLKSFALLLNYYNIVLLQSLISLFY